MATCKDCLHADVCQNHCDEQYCEGCSSCMFRSCNFSDKAEKCPNFKDRSRFVELPCKVGDHVFRLCGTKKTRYVAERIVSAVTLCGNGSWSILSTAYDALGKTVFLTREEAEAELARRTDNG